MLSIVTLTYQNCAKFESGKTSSLSSLLRADSLTITGPEDQTPTKGTVSIQGKCATGLDVSLRGDLSAPMTVPCAGEQFSATVQLSPGDGNKTVIAQQTDLMGHSSAVSRTFILDTVVPALSLLSPQNGAAVKSAAVIQGLCETGLDVVLVEGGKTSKQMCTDGMVAVSLPLASPDGAVTVVLSQTDRAGNKSELSLSLVKDNVAPAVTVVMPAENATVSGSAVVSGACESGLNVTIAGAGVTAPVDLPCVSGAYSASVVFTTGAGAKAVQVSQTDVAGNSSTVSRSVTRQADAAPAIAINQPAANSVFKTTLTVTGSCQTGLPIALSGSGLVSPTSATCTSGAFSVLVTFTAGDGSKNIIVAQTNASGVTGSDSRTFVRDTTPPALTIASPAANSVFMNSVQLVGACENGLPVQISGSGAAAASSATCANAVYSATVQMSSGDGSKTIQVSQTDAAANTTSISLVLVRDSTAPVVTITAPAANTSAETGLTISGTCEGTFAVTASGSGVASSTSKACSANAFSMEVVFSAGDGDKTVQVSQTDAAGNVGSTTRIYKKAAKIADGAVLYAQNCASCHGNLSSSSKLGRTAAEITNAIATQPAMAGLQTILSSSDISAIANALSGSSAGACMSVASRGSAKNGVNRLTRFELEASAAAVLPSTKSAMANNWSNLFKTFPESPDVDDVKKFSPFFSESQLDAWIDIADQIGTAAVSADIDSCLSVTSPAKTCYQQATANWVKKVWRRPLTSAEVDEIVNQVASLSKSDAITRLVSLALISPRFVFRVESSDMAVGSRVRVDAYAVASRISYATTGAGPDSALLDAASKGELETISQIDAHTRRLLATPAAKAKFEDFVRSWLKFGKLSSSNETYPVVSGNLNPDELTVDATTREVLDFVNHVVWKENGSLRDLMTRPIALARNPSIAKIYGSTANSATVKEPTAYPAPNHPGLALRVAFLMSGSQFSSPIRRGVFVLQRLLCSDLPSPSAEILAMRGDFADSIDPLTMPNYETVKAVTAAPACTSCHSVINPMGFTFENFDALGRLQMKQDVVDLNTGKTLASHPLPPPSTLSLDPGVTGTYGSGQEMAAALSKSTRVKSCMNREFFRYVERRVEQDADTCRLNESLTPFAEDRPIQESLVKTIANEDVFWRGAN